MFLAYFVLKEFDVLIYYGHRARGYDSKLQAQALSQVVKVSVDLIVEAVILDHPVACCYGLVDSPVAQVLPLLGQGLDDEGEVRLIESLGHVGAFVVVGNHPGVRLIRCWPLDENVHAPFGNTHIIALPQAYEY